MSQGNLAPKHSDGKGAMVALGLFMVWCLLWLAFSTEPYARLWGANLLAFADSKVRVGFGVAAVVAALGIVRPEWFGALARLWSALLSHLQGYRGAVVLCGVVLIMASALSAHEAFLGDGTLRAEDAMEGTAVLPSEIISTAVAFVLVRGVPSSWGIDGFDALRMISIACAVLFAIGLWWLTPRASASGNRTVIFWILTFGSARLLAGYVETYTTALVTFSLCTLAMVAYRRGHLAAGVPIGLWALAMLSHVTAVLLIPAMLWTLGWQTDGKWKLVSRPNMIFSGIALLVGGGVIAAFYIIQVNRISVSTGHFLMAFLPRPPHNYGVISPAHFADFANQWLLLAPGFLVALIAGLITRAQPGVTSGLGGNSAWYRRPWMFWLLAGAFPVTAGLLIDPKLGWARDWDLYCVIFSPALVGLALWLDQQEAVIKRLAGSVAVIAVAIWLSFSVDGRAERVRFEALLDLDPTRSDYGHEIMAQYYRRHDDWEGSTRHYRQALAVSENMRYRLNIAAGYYLARKYEEAERWYRAAVARDSTSAEAWHGLSLVLSDLRRPEEAMTCALNAYHAMPGNLAYAFRVGSVHLQLRQFELALPYLERAARSQPTLSNRLNALAICYDELGRPDEARAAIEESLRPNPEEPLALLNASRIALHQGDTTAARRYLTGYESLVPPEGRHPEAKRVADSLAVLGAN